MALYPDYCTLAELKAQLRIDALDTQDDTMLGVAISAAARAIDYECNRQFGQGAGARYFTYDRCLYLDGRPALPIFDLMSLDEFAIEISTDDDGSYPTALVSGEDYELWPYNAAADGRPWTHLLSPSRANNLFPWTNRGVKITATWGWDRVPDVVTAASLIQSARFFVRRDSAYGVAGSPDQGNELRLLDRLDADVAVLLTSVVRRWGAV